jgi:hypothetical protein
VLRLTRWKRTTRIFLRNEAYAYSQPAIQQILWTTILICSANRSAEPQLILRRSDEGADHRTVAAGIIWQSVVQDVEPEVIAILVRVAAQVAKVLHQHKRWFVLAVLELLDFDHVQQDLRACLAPIRRPLCVSAHRQHNKTDLSLRLTWE